MRTDNYMIIAHRGASDYAPENTFAAFDLAVQMGVRHIELDIHETADGQAVVIHDNTLDRTTSGTGPVSHCSLVELKELDAGSWFSPRFANERIPAFAEILERYGRKLHLHVEIKGGRERFCSRVVDAIRMFGAERHVTITSFNAAYLAEVRCYAPDLSTGWLVHEVSDGIVQTARQMGIKQLCPNASSLHAEIVTRLHKEGFIVRAYGVKSEDVMRAVVHSGADGMTVNFPDKLVAYFAKEIIPVK